MKLYQFEPPTDHYDGRHEEIDEQICELIKIRKNLSGSTPSFPTKRLISDWSRKYDLYEEFLQGLFFHLFNEEIYKPAVVPKGFMKNIPVLKSFEKEEVFFAVSLIRQYENASVVHFTIDREEPDVEEKTVRTGIPFFFELSIKGKEDVYDCRNDGGGGSGGHESYTYIISPALPEDLSDINLAFKGYIKPDDKSPGLEFVISLNN